MGFSGRPQIYKEYTEHPSGGKHLDKAVYGDLGKELKPILGRSFGMKVDVVVKEKRVGSKYRRRYKVR